MEQAHDVALKGKAQLGKGGSRGVGSVAPGSEPTKNCRGHHGKGGKARRQGEKKKKRKSPKRRWRNRSELSYRVRL